MNPSYFENKLAEVKAEITSCKNKSQLYTTKRTIVFILIVLISATAYDLGYTWLFGAAVALLLYFFALIKGHSDLHDQLTYKENKHQVIKDYLARFSDDWKSFNDTGEDFLPRNLTQDIDLNILGPASIFQYTSVARTAAGRQLLAQRLQPFPIDQKELAQRQAETKFFVHHPEEAIHLQTLIRQIPLNHSMTRLLDYIAGPKRDFSSALGKLSVAGPALSFVLLGLSLLDIIPIQISMVAFSLQLGISLLALGKTSTNITPLYRMNREMVYYYQFLAAMVAILPEKTGHLDPSEIKASLRPIRLLGKLCVLAEMRHNFILLFLLNFLFMWDFHIVRLFISWQKKYGDQLQNWLFLCNETETALSLATIGHTRKNTAFPELLDDAKPRIEAAELENLLISDSKSVANSVALAPSLNIITGSNMSGKTTWLRTIASSCILAYAGAPVPAAHFSLSPMTVLTSIRINDDLGSGISTFYAELTRIKAMIEATETEKPVLAVIDEIFKGTNSADRIICAKTALIHLTRATAITLVSTHDFELCHLQSDNGIPVHNFHFEEHYQDNEIVFDYLMKDGPCETTNAQFLLKMVGIN